MVSGPAPDRKFPEESCFEGCQGFLEKTGEMSALA